MYIFIFEDGSMNLFEIAKEDDLASADYGLLDIIDVSEANHPKRYFDGCWSELEIAERT